MHIECGILSPGDALRSVRRIATQLGIISTLPLNPIENSPRKGRSSPVSKMWRARWRAKCKAASSGEIALQPSSLHHGQQGLVDTPIRHGLKNCPADDTRTIESGFQRIRGQPFCWNQLECHFSLKSRYQKAGLALRILLSSLRLRPLWPALAHLERRVAELFDGRVLRSLCFSFSPSACEGRSRCRSA